MGRTLSIHNVFSKKFKKFPFTGVHKDVFGEPEVGGLWIVYGPDKNGKTTLALMLGDYLSRIEPTLYISGEEGICDSFQQTCLRAGLTANNKSLKFLGYITIEELKNRLGKRRSEKIIILDNITVYQEELKNGELLRLSKQYPNTTFIFLAHEDKGEPYTATAKACKRYAKIIINIKGLVGFVSGRCPGGKIVINEEKAALIHGDSINDKILE
jgi:hypothetical protein